MKYLDNFPYVIDLAIKNVLLLTLLTVYTIEGVLLYSMAYYDKGINSTYMVCITIHILSFAFRCLGMTKF